MGFGGFHIDIGKHVVGYKSREVKQLLEKWRQIICQAGFNRSLCKWLRSYFNDLCFPSPFLKFL